MINIYPGQSFPDLYGQGHRNFHIVGFTNSALVELLNPGLTAVKQPAFEMGQTATELLIKLIENKRPVTEFEKVVLQTEIFIRHSSANKIIKKNTKAKKAVN